MANSPYDSGAGTVTLNTNLPDKYENVHAIPEAFGSAIAHGMQELGHGAVKASLFYGQVAADDQLNKYEAQLSTMLHGDPNKMVPGVDGKMHPDTGFFGLKGDDMMRARPGIVKQMDDLRTSLHDQLQIPESKLQFDIHSRRLQNLRTYEVGQAFERANTAYNNNVIDAGEETQKFNISTNPINDTAFDGYSQNLKSFYIKRAQVNGLGTEGIQDAIRQAGVDAKKARGEGALKMIENSLYVNRDIPGAKRIFDQVEQKIDPEHRIKIARILTPQVDRYQTQELYRQGGYETGVTHPVPSFSPEVNKTLDGAALKYGLDPGMMRTFAKIESSGNPEARSGSYKGLLQTRSGDVDSAVAEIAQQARDFKRDYGRDPDAADLYMIHQQGAGGYTNHLAYPNRPAWENMAATAEGRQKGEAWAKAAIWGNVPDKDKARFGGVDNVTSEAFVSLWRGRVANSGGSPRDLTDDEDAPAGFTMSKAEALRRAEQQTEGMPQNIRDGLIRMVQHRFNLVRAENSEQRAETAVSAMDAIKAASVGNEGVKFPDDAVRQFVPEKYEQYRSNFDIASHVGSQLRAARYASSDELQGIAGDIGSGQGWRSDQLREKIKMSGAIDPDGDYNRWKAHAIGALREIAGQRQKGLQSDPAGYVSGSPEVQDKIRALDAVPEKDEAGRLKAYQAIRDAAWKKQGEMGVPENERRILTAAEAQQRVSMLMDPNKTPHALQGMKQLQQAYGPQWNRALQDMVQIGGLPTGYQSVLNLHPQDADLMARALREGAVSGDKKEKFSWDKALGQTAGQAAQHSNRAIIDATIGADRDKTGKYRQSLVDQGLAAPDVESNINDIRTLAYAHSYYLGQDAASAAQAAIKGFLDDTNFYSKARVPAQQFYEIRDAARNVSKAITGDSVTVPSSYGRPGFADASEYAAHASSNLAWKNTPEGNGIVAYDQQDRPMKWKDGSPIVIRFGNVGKLQDRQEVPPARTEAVPNPFAGGL
jgi:hypothetical protein